MTPPARSCKIDRSRNFILTGAPLIFEVSAEDETERFASALALSLPTSSVVGLIGPLGAGKTRLVQAVARAVRIDDGVVASPTFVLIHEYEGRVPIFHFDAYRLKNADEFVNLGPEEYFSRPGWSFVEWADRVSEFLPPERLDIVIEPTGLTSRRFTLLPLGPTGAQIVAQINRLFGPSGVRR
jgi:tRNA threonylcarbamoyladenosine biosynthesis protein TsaE